MCSIDEGEVMSARQCLSTDAQVPRGLTDDQRLVLRILLRRAEPSDINPSDAMVMTQLLTVPGSVN